MIHIENQLKLHLKIITKKDQGRSTQHTANRSICSPNKILFHLQEKLKKVLIDTVGDPALSTTPNRTLSFSFTIFITLEVSRGEV